MQRLKQIFWGVDKNDADFRTGIVCLFVLSCVHFLLGLYLGKQAFLMMSLLLWASIAILLWDRRQHFKINQNKISSFLGYVLVAAVLVISVIHPGEKMLGFFPLAAYLGWFLIFIGAAQAKLYLKEFCLKTFKLKI